MSARTVARGNGRALIIEKYTVDFFHPFSGPAPEPSVNFKGKVSAVLNPPRPDLVTHFRVAQRRVIQQAYLLRPHHEK
jgi:hypothetical protein